MLYHPRTKRVSKKSAEIDAELLKRANKLECDHQLQHQKQIGENTEQVEPTTYGRKPTISIEDLNNFDTDGKEAKYIQINRIVGKLTPNKEITKNGDGPENAELENSHLSRTEGIEI